MLVLSACPAAAHPLDLLSADEIRTVRSVLRDSGAATKATRFAQVTLAPPDKDAVWRWPQSGTPPRRALVVLRTGTKVSEALVDLGARRLVRIERRPNVQTTIDTQDADIAVPLVKADPRWQAAMRARGIADFSGIFCDSLSAGNFGKPERRRLLRVPCYDARGTTNAYGRPIEGVVALVDVDSRVVLEVADRGAVPISRADPSLGQERQAALRPALKPVQSSAPAGPNFTIEGGLVRWAAWSFHLGFDQRVGPIVSTVRYRDSTRDRPVLYQGHLSEMFVPYMDPDPNWAFRSYLDVGEFGLGSSASKLLAGADCPAGATMISVTLPNLAGEPYDARDVMCLFERNTGVPLWRRFDIVTGSHEVRQDVELVVRSVPTIGNYDYVYDWVFNLKGEIRIDVGATGVAAAKGVAAERADQLPSDAHGTLVGPNLVAPHHDHFLSFRLDLDVDGRANRFVRDRLVVQPLPPGSARRSLWTKATSVAATESWIDPGHAPELWRVASAQARSGLGYPTSFEILAGHSASSLLALHDPPQRRAAFSSRPLWLTAYKPGELYAAGDYPNQSSGGEGLPRFVDGDRTDGEDLVVWYTMGFHHVTRPEDWPVLPTVRHSVTLRPHRFFARNPTMDVPRDFQPAAE